MMVADAVDLEPVSAAKIPCQQGKEQGVLHATREPREGIHAIPVDPEGEKIMRMNAQTARIEAGSVVLPRCAAWLDEFRHELLAFPVGRYSDQVDAFSQALNRGFATREAACMSGIIGFDGRITWLDNRA
jgi:predicted phage terminase large subunit-like protein